MSHRRKRRNTVYTLSKSGPRASPEGESGAITPIQQQAITLMLSGSNLTDVAKSVQISRMTIHNWLRHDAAFIAAYNAWRFDVARSARARLMGLAEPAVKAIQQALEAGDAHLALRLLKDLGILSPEPPGSDNAAEVQQQMTLTDRARRQGLTQQKIELDLSLYGEWKPPEEEKE